jgi:glucokinase
VASPSTEHAVDGLGRARLDQRVRLLGPDTLVLALDLGASQIRGSVVQADGQLRGRATAVTPHDGGPEAIYAACATTLITSRDTLPPDDRARVVAVGISSMGPVDPWRGMVVDPPNVPALRDAPLAAEIEARLGLPAFLDRDTNVAALAERWLGAARDCDHFLYVTVSTGLGGAIFRDGFLLRGPDGTAGELGHISLMPVGGPLCGCGGSGHLEAIASGSGLARQAAAALASSETSGSSAAGSNHHASPFLAARLSTAGRVTGRDVAEGELAGDALCVRLMGRARQAFAIACVGWVDAFNPERVVVGGAVAQGQGDRWLDPARAEVARTAFRGPGSRVRIVPAQLGPDVGLVGAWPLVAERLDLLRRD